MIEWGTKSNKISNKNASIQKHKYKTFLRAAFNTVGLLTGKKNNKLQQLNT